MTISVTHPLPRQLELCLLERKGSLQQLRSETLFKPWPETRMGIAGCTPLLAPAVLIPCKAPPAPLLP